MSEHYFVTLEDLSGVGSIVHKGQTVATGVPYRLTVQQKKIVTRSMTSTGEINGLKDTSGSVELPYLVAAKLNGLSVDLLLEDGRRFPCAIVSTSGELMARGGIADVFSRGLSAEAAWPGHEKGRDH